MISGSYLINTAGRYVNIQYVTSGYIFLFDKYHWVARYVNIQYVIIGYKYVGCIQLYWTAAGLDWTTELLLELKV